MCLSFNLTLQMTLRGFTDNIAHLAVSPSNGSIAVTTDDATSHDYIIRVWSLQNGAAHAILHGHTGDINRIAFDPLSHLLVSISDDGTLRVWDVDGTYEVTMPELNTAAADHTTESDQVIAQPADTVLTVDNESSIETVIAEPESAIAPSPIARRLSRSAPGRTASTTLTAPSRRHGAAAQRHAAATAPRLAQPEVVAGVAPPPDSVVPATASSSLVSSATPESARCRVVVITKMGPALDYNAPLKLKQTALGLSPAGGLAAVGDENGAVRIFRIAELSQQVNAVCAAVVAQEASGSAAKSHASGRRGATVAFLESDSDGEGNLSMNDSIAAAVSSGGVFDVGARMSSLRLSDTSSAEPAASGANPSLASLWKPLDNPQLVATLAGHVQEVTLLEFNADSTVLASVSHDEGRVFLWRWSKGKLRDACVFLTRTTPLMTCRLYAYA